MKLTYLLYYFYIFWNEVEENNRFLSLTLQKIANNLNCISVIFCIFFSNSEKIIKNINIPSCRNCIHYKPSMYYL